MAKCIADERCCFGEKKNPCARPQDYYHTAVQGSTQDPLNSLKRCCRCSSDVCKPSKSIFTHVCVSLTMTMDGILPIQMHRRLSRFTYIYLRPPPEKIIIIIARKMKTINAKYSGNTSLKYTYTLLLHRYVKNTHA